MDRELRRLLTEAEARPVVGWDFSRLGPRLTSTPPPWSYDEIVLRHARESPDLLDMGTGGGEWLAALASRPRRTVATEGWEPNVNVAGDRLRPLGITVVRADPAPDNVDQDPEETRGLLPFPSRSFQLVVNRHEAFVAAEVARVLVPGGVFVTQQVGVGRGFHALLGIAAPPTPARTWNLRLATEQVTRARLRVVDGDEADEVVSFADVGALVWYLRAIPWTIPGFRPREHLGTLEALHRRAREEGPLSVRMPAFWLEAKKPA